jgi:hypothetical protein
MFGMFGIGPIEVLIIAIIVLGGGGLLAWMFSRKG